MSDLEEQRDALAEIAGDWEGLYRKAKAEVEKLRAERGALLVMVRKVEWTRYTRGGVGCHFCKGGPGDDLNSPCKRHEPGCPMAEALARYDAKGGE